MKIEFKKGDVVNHRNIIHLMRFIPEDSIFIDWNDITFKKDVAIKIIVEVGE